VPAILVEVICGCVELCVVGNLSRVPFDEIRLFVVSVLALCEN